MMIMNVQIEARPQVQGTVVRSQPGVSGVYFGTGRRTGTGMQKVCLGVIRLR